ncbi:MAG TPA: hypothetical protein VFW87_13335, partial [Pirellulales bacterium]|nr:hypothetical protein [Pirellulales bacterium]
IATDQGCRMKIADHRVFFEGQGHGRDSGFGIRDSGFRVQHFVNAFWRVQTLGFHKYAEP